jgi:integrase
MAQLEDPGNLAKMASQHHRLITLILIRCGLRISDTLALRQDCITRDKDGAPYLRYLNHKMKREALVPIAPTRPSAPHTRGLWPQPTADAPGGRPRSILPSLNTPPRSGPTVPPSVR